MVRSQFRARSGDGVKRSPNENPATATVETTGQLEVAVEAPHNNIVFILLSVPLMISTNTFAYLAKNPETGKYDHNVPTVTLLAEVTKVGAVEKDYYVLWSRGQQTRFSSSLKS